MIGAVLIDNFVVSDRATLDAGANKQAFGCVRHQRNLCASRIGALAMSTGFASRSLALQGAAYSNS